MRDDDLEAAIRDLMERLIRSRSATDFLESCRADHEAGIFPEVHAVRVSNARKAITAGHRLQLCVGPDEVIHYRRVKLVCEGVVLAEADNWYVPARLPPELNRALDMTDTTFGRLARSLDAQRRTISVNVLAGEPDGTRAWLFECTALVVDDRGTPLAAVVETFSEALLRSRREQYRGNPT